MVLHANRHAIIGPVRWTARALSLGVVALLAVFATEPAGWPTASEWVALAFFPLGLVAGLIVAWKRELLGAAISLVSLACFYVWMFAGTGRFVGPYVALFSLPAALFLVAGLARRTAPPRS